MTFFSAFGFDVVEIQDKDIDDAYNILQEELVRKNLNFTLQKRDERILENNIKYTINNRFYYGVGLKKDNEWVGVCLCNDSDKWAWIGNLVIKKEYRKTKALIVLLHFILNILFEKENVSVGIKNTEQFEKLLVEPNKEIKFRVFHPNTKIRCAEIINKEK